MKSYQRILDVVCRSLDKLVELGRLFDGLIPSTLELDGMRLPGKLPPAIPGQREGDRAYPGCNLMHDHPLLKVLNELGEIIDRPDYQELVDQYLAYFANYCASTDSGLFPWGEHAFWDFVDGRPGNGFILARARRPLVHDHLNQAPFWLWERLWRCNSRCVIDFGRGLDHHWIDDERTEYSRHAHLFKKEHYQNFNGSTCDFPRHSGFYICDLAFAYVRSGDIGFREQLCRYLAYWWDRRLDNGLLPGKSRGTQAATRANLVQTLSLTASLWETAEFLELSGETGLCDLIRSKAEVYLQGVTDLLGRSGSGECIADYSVVQPKDTTVMRYWGSCYGGSNGVASAQALLLMPIYRVTHKPELLSFAEDIAAATLAVDFPEDTHVPARDAATIIELLCDLDELAGKEDSWRESLVRLTEQVMVRYFDNCLPRGATGIDWYESQLGTGYLIHALARAAFVLNDGCSGRISPNYTLR